MENGGYGANGHSAQNHANQVGFNLEDMIVLDQVRTSSGAMKTKTVPVSMYLTTLANNICS